MITHALLNRQLRAAINSDGDLNLSALLDRVAEAYHDHDRDRKSTDHAIRTMSAELEEMIEELGRQNDVLKLARAKADAASAAKTAFLANMSHEIRTPLNGIMGMAQALEGEPLTSSQREKVSILIESGKALTSLLNDVLDMAKIEAGKLQIDPIEGDLVHAMKRVCQLFDATAEQRGLELSVQFDPNFPRRLLFDPLRVRQCVSNLVSNAMKFTPKGGVSIQMQAIEQPDGEYVVSIDVLDTGIGMSEEVLANLFTPFTQADGAITREYGGTGLGLSITRRLAQLMSGDVIAHSEPGKGSIFRFTFRASYPRASATDATPDSVAASPVLQKPDAPKRILLVDDNPVNRKVIRIFLGPLNYEIVEGKNGQEALDALACGDFDLLLLDVHMPVMDGKEAVSRIRNANASWSSIPVIAITADAMSGDRERLVELGMTDYVAKPVDQNELLNKVLSILNASDGTVLTGPTVGPVKQVA